jgi:hypothetical protein
MDSGIVLDGTGKRGLMIYACIGRSDELIFAGIFDVDGAHSCMESLTRRTHGGISHELIDWMDGIPLKVVAA